MHSPAPASSYGTVPTCPPLQTLAPADPSYDPHIISSDILTWSCPPPHSNHDFVLSVISGSVAAAIRLFVRSSVLQSDVFTLQLSIRMMSNSNRPLKPCRSNNRAQLFDRMSGSPCLEPLLWARPGYQQFRRTDEQRRQGPASFAAAAAAVVYSNGGGSSCLVVTEFVRLPRAWVRFGSVWPSCDSLDRVDLNLQ
jgi:hypothetical protein